MSSNKEDLNPYVGPRPFERTDQDRARFFGRDRETEEIVSLIFGHPVILVYAQSGAGKTSLFNAQVAPTLEENRFEVLPLTRVRGAIPEEIEPQDIANLYVFNALLNLDREADPQALVDKSLAAFLAERPRATDAERQPVPQAIIFDQFEELFTLYPERWCEQQEVFFHQVTEALAADPLLRVVFVIREDYLAQLDPVARLLPERLRTHFRLERLREDAALLAVKEPLADSGRAFAPEVAESLVKKLLKARAVSATGETAEVEGQYVEPVQLQVVCLRLWSSLPPETTVISQAHFQEFDVSRALSNFYENVIQGIKRRTGVNEATLRHWCGKTLITPMETRGTVYRGEDSTGGIPNAAVDILESRHLIRAEYRAGARWYELTHDCFIEPILASNKEYFKAVEAEQQWRGKLKRGRRSPYHILSLDGGGIRVVLTATLLERLEVAHPGFLSKVDLLAGTSTGGILALGLAAGLTPKEIGRLYEESSTKVFAKSVWDDIRDLGKLIGADYSNEPLKQAILDFFGEITLGDLQKQVLISSFDLDNELRRPGALRTWRPKFFHNFPGEGSYADQKVVDVALRTSAAPASFPIYQGYIDGGVVAQNPSMCALAQALDLETGGQELRQVILLSMGTGISSRFLPQQNADWGLVQWAPHLMNLMIEGSVGLVHYQCLQLLGERYLRINPILPTPIGMDEVDQIPLLKEVAEMLNLDYAIEWLKRYYK
jgi:hypothetical protein